MADKPQRSLTQINALAQRIGKDRTVEPAEMILPAIW
jgi:hypothetical protein